MPSTSITLHCTTGTSDKLYHMTRTQEIVTVRWGRRGATLEDLKGYKVTTFRTAADAAEWMNKKIDEKAAKGYRVFRAWA